MLNVVAMLHKIEQIQIEWPHDTYPQCKGGQANMESIGGQKEGSVGGRPKCGAVKYGTRKHGEALIFYFIIQEGTATHYPLSGRSYILS